MLFTFPSRYWYTIGLSGVFSLTGWSRQFQTGFLVSRPTQDTHQNKRSCVYVTVTLFGPTFQMVPLPCLSFMQVLQPQLCRNNVGLGCSPFARHYLGNHFCFLLLRVLRCFSSPGLPHPASGIVVRLHRTGLPHSEIKGSTVICTSPLLIAAYHVLLRL